MAEDLDGIHSLQQEFQMSGKIYSAGNGTHLGGYE